MKKLLTGILLIGGILLFSSKMYAAEPQDQGAQLSGKFFHARINGSTVTQTNFPISVALANTSSNSGGQTINYQNCITKFIVQLSSTATFSVFDGASTTVAIMNILGNSLGATYPNTIVLAEDHLGPLCGTPGNAFNMVINTGTVSGVSVPMSINYEGYTTAGAGSIAN